MSDPRPNPGRGGISPNNPDNLCGCITCVDLRAAEVRQRRGVVFIGPQFPGWRYACEICGNKRCPHHTDHRLACTDSNEPGQPGSVYA